MLKFWRRNHPSNHELIEDLVDKMNSLSSQLDKCIKSFDEYTKRSEEEKKALGNELKQKTAFIENLFSTMLTTFQSNVNATPPKKEKDKGDDDNIIDISKLPASTQGYIRGKLNEAKVANGAKK